MNDSSIDCQTDIEEIVLTKLATSRIKPSPLEIASALRAMVDKFRRNGIDGKKLGRQESIRKAAEIYGRSYNWAIQQLCLLRLCSEVQDYLEKKEISYQIGIALTGLREDSQIQFARHIINEGLSYKSALAYIHNCRLPENIGEKGRTRTPSDDYVIFIRTIREMSNEFDNILEMPIKKVLDMFKTKPLKDFKQTIIVLENLSNQAKLFADNLRGARR